MKAWRQRRKTGHLGTWMPDVKDREKNAADTEVCDLDKGRQCRVQVADSTGEKR